MMDFPRGYKKGGRADPDSLAQGWQGQIAQAPQSLQGTTPPVMDFQPVDFQGGATTTDPTQYDDGGWMSDESMAFELPDALKGNFGVGGGGAVNFEDFDVASMKELFPTLMLKDINDVSMEQAGLGGTRWSSVLGQKIADANARAEEQWASDMFSKWIASQEAAKGRGLSAGIASQGNALQKAMFEARLPMEIAASMASLGGAAQEAEMQPWSMAYQDWLRTTPEAAMQTYGGGLLNLLGQEPGGPTQYEPGWASGLMGIGSSLLPFVGGGKGESSTYPKESWW
jgi:hypothetical protein